MGEMSATQIAEAIAAKFKAEGSRTSKPRGGNWRDDFIDVQLPNGQVFRIKVEEVV
jgi:hypothetical protein